MEKMHDLGLELLPDGTIRLEQFDYCGESVILDMHPCQLRLIAERAAILSPDITQQKPSGIPAGLIRRLERLRSRADSLYSLLVSVPCFPPGGDITDDVVAAQGLAEGFDYLFRDFDLDADDDGCTSKPNASPPASACDSLGNGCLPSADECAGGQSERIAETEPGLF